MRNRAVKKGSVTDVRRVLFASLLILKKHFKLKEANRKNLYRYLWRLEKEKNNDKQ